MVLDPMRVGRLDHAPLNSTVGLDPAIAGSLCYIALLAGNPVAFSLGGITARVVVVGMANASPAESLTVVDDAPRAMHDAP